MKSRRMKSSRMKSSRAVLCGCLVALVALTAACGTTSQRHEGSTPSATATTPAAVPDPTAAESGDPTIDAGDQLEDRLNKITGVRATAVSDENDLNCTLDDNVSVVDIRFTAADSTAMRKALVTGRQALQDLISNAVICLGGTYDDTGNTIRIQATDTIWTDDPEELSPTDSMIDDLVRDSRLKPAGGLHLVWTEEVDSGDVVLTVGNDLDEESPSPTMAVQLFRQLEKQWDPPSDYSWVSIFVSAGSGGDLGATQHSRFGRWSPVPDALITTFLTTLHRTGSAQVDRSEVAKDDIEDRIDFLYADENDLPWSTRQQIAHNLIKAYYSVPATERGTSFGVRSGQHTELDFTTDACEGLLPGDDTRQLSEQTHKLYLWYADHYPTQARKNRVDHC